MKYCSLVVFVASILDFASAWQHIVETKGTLKGVTLLEWFWDTFYKTFYVVLITAILLCAIYNFLKNKFSKKTEGWTVEKSKSMDSCAKVLSLVETKQRNDSGDEGRLRFPETENQLRQRLKQTQEEIQCLRDQLALSIDNKTELESTLALIDKDKITAEMQLELGRVQDALELEKIKKENLLVQREIQKLLEEKDLTDKEVKRLDRDIRISERAILDAEFIENRLVEMKREAAVLKKQYDLLKIEKGKATSILSEPPSQCSVQDDMDFEYATNWTAPDFVRDYMSLD